MATASLRFVSRAHILWVIGNPCAIGLWIVVAAQIWPRPPYEHCDFAPGDPAYFFLLVVPLFALALIANAGGLIWTTIRGFKTRRWVSMCAVALTCVAWMGAGAYDHARGMHYVTSDCLNG
jgi:hypothetical protein